MPSDRTKRRRIQRDVEETLAEISDQGVRDDEYLLIHTDSNLIELSDEPSGTIELNCMNRDYNLDDEYLISTYSETKQVESNVNEKLTAWAVNNNITNVLDELLKILNPIIPDLPKTSRTLLRTPTSYNISEICVGQYFNFGLRKYI